MIARSRGTREATALIGAHYAGTIVRDGHPSYRVFSNAKSQTCLAHLLRRTDELLEIHRMPGVQKWLLALKAVLQRSLKVRDRRDNAQVGPHGLMVSIGQVEAETDRLLDHAPANDAIQCFVRHLRREREALFTFLHYDAIPATNYLSEQALRPAVVNRKMSGGNNTPHGAEAQAILMTVLHSAKKRAVDGLAILVNALRSPSSVTQLM